LNGLDEIEIGCLLVYLHLRTKIINVTISKYFENVLGADPPELSEEVLNLINNDHFENVDVDALDSEITEYDIIKAIAKLKPEKSAGSDNIIGEIFTASPIFFAPLLKKLFNYMFNTSSESSGGSGCKKNQLTVLTAISIFLDCLFTYPD
jgi:hypothetical protein